VRDRSKEYEAAAAVVLGISPDPVEDLRAFADNVVARVFPGVKPDEHDDLVLGALAELTATA
jgi:peroxiredoxin